MLAENQEWIMQTPELFSFAETVSYLSRSQAECLYRIEDSGIYKLIHFGGGPILLQIASAAENGLLVRLLEAAEPLDSDLRLSVEAYIKDWFDLNTDLTPFYKLASGDALLRPLVERFRGLRCIGIPDLFEAICWGILGQQINLPFAYTLKRRFVESFGVHAERNGGAYWLFPRAERIAELGIGDLSELQITRKKAEYLIGVAELVAEGRLSKESLLVLGDLKQAEKTLTQIRGIGPWTANYVLMRCLRFPSAFPIDDVGLHNAVKHLLGSDSKPTIPEIKRLAAAWTNWEAYATFYLWRCLY